MFKNILKLTIIVLVSLILVYPYYAIISYQTTGTLSLLNFARYSDIQSKFESQLKSSKESSFTYTEDSGDIYDINIDLNKCTVSVVKSKTGVFKVNDGSVVIDLKSGEIVSGDISLYTSHLSSIVKSLRGSDMYDIYNTAFELDKLIGTKGFKLFDLTTYKISDGTSFRFKDDNRLIKIFRGNCVIKDIEY